MDGKTLLQSKTFWVAVGGVLMAVGGYLHGDMSLIHAIGAVLASCATVTLRQGQGVPIKGIIRDPMGADKK